MDSVTTEHKQEVDDRFDTARITAAVDALAEKHQGREDAFRPATAQLRTVGRNAPRSAGHADVRLYRDRRGSAAHLRLPTN